jgi:peptidoglycan/xylan/chitin deacetylase (PgdA/CDA1 family)
LTLRQLPSRGQPQPSGPRSVPILMYHEIAPPGETTSRLAVRPDSWAEQLGYLHSDGYRTVTAAQLAAALAGRGQLPDRAIVLTFDDGFEDFHRRALPLLAEYGFTATLFVTTGWVEDSGPLPAGLSRPGRMLSWSQVAEARAAGIEIAAHSRLHPQLDQIPPRQLQEELHASKAQLEDRLGALVSGLAYPFGYSNARVRRAARDLGHGYACAVGNAMMSDQPDMFALPRLTIRRTTGMPVFQEVARGASVPQIYLQDRVLTKGWAMVRRTRAAIGSVSRGA